MCRSRHVSRASGPLRGEAARPAEVRLRCPCIAEQLQPQVVDDLRRLIGRPTIDTNQIRSRRQGVDLQDPPVRRGVIDRVARQIRDGNLSAVGQVGPGQVHDVGLVLEKLDI